MLKSSKILSLFLLNTITILLSLNAWGGNYYGELLARSQAYQADTNTRMELLSIFETCGSPDAIEVNCVLGNLQNTSVKITDPALAQQIVADYQSMLAFDMQNAECISNDLMASNYAIGYCYLAMNFYILSEMDREVTSKGLHQCLNAQLGTMAFEGNLVAQYRLFQLSGQSNRKSDADMWKQAIKYNKPKRVYDFLVNCYD